MVSPEPGASPCSRAERATLLAASIIYTLLLQPATNVQRLNAADASLFAYGGRLVRAGLVPYKDFWEAKPPLIYYIEALAFGVFGVSWWASTLMQLAFTLASVVTVVLLAEQWFLSRAGRWAFVVIALLVANNPMAAEGSNLTETYQVLPSLLSLLCLGTPRKGRSNLTLAGSGALLGLAMLTRPVAASLAAAAALIIFVQARATDAARASSWQRLALAYLSFGGGLCAVLGVAAGYFAHHGVAGEMWFATIAYNASVYRTMRPAAPFSSLERYFMLNEQFGLTNLYLLYALAAVLSLGSWPARSRTAVFEKLAIAGLWLIADVCFALATGRSYGHYVYPLGFSAAFAGALLFEVLWLRLARAPAMAATAAAALLIAIQWVPLATPIAKAAARGWAGARNTCPTADEHAGAVLKRLVPRREPVLVWGLGQGPVLTSGNRPAHPLLCVLNFQAPYALARWEKSYLDLLSRRAVRVFVNTEGMMHRMLAGAKDPTAMGPTRRSVQALLRRNYQRVPFEAPPYDIYVVRGMRWRGQLPALPSGCKQHTPVPARWWPIE